VRCLVLGANGFIGSHVVDLLASKFGHVSSFARSTYKFKNNQVTSFTGDFLDSSALEHALEGHDCVIHSISSSTPALAAEDPVFDVSANLLPTLSLVKSMAKKNVKKLIYLSSGGTVYGNPSELPVSESALISPVSVYGSTKAAIENYLQILCEQYGIALVILRPSNPYGPRQFNKGSQGLIATLLHKAIKKESIVLFDEGKAIRDYIYIDDLALAIYKSIITNTTGVYNISSGIPLSVFAIKELVEKITEYQFIFSLYPKREFDIDEIVLDSTKAQKLLDWQPVVEIESGICKQFNWMKTQSW